MKLPTLKTFQEANSKFITHKKEEYDYVRRLIFELFKKQPVITSDDIRANINCENNKIIGAVFGELHKKGVIIPVGFHASNIKTSHKRTLFEWQLNPQTPNKLEI